MTRRRNAAHGRYRSVFETSLGWGGVVANDAGLLEVFLPFGGTSRAQIATQIGERYPAVKVESPLTINAARLLQRYFAGEPVRFDLPLDWSVFTLFQTTVYQAVISLSYGEVRSYMLTDTLISYSIPDCEPASCWRKYNSEFSRFNRSFRSSKTRCSSCHFRS